MRILYDYQMFSIQKFGGVTRYFTELIKNLPKDKSSFSLSILHTENQHLISDRIFFKKQSFLPNKNFQGKYFLEEKLKMLNRAYSVRQIKKGHYDVFHPTYYDDYYLSYIKKPFIITVHDLIYFKFKDSFPGSDLQRQKMQTVIEKADRIIAISENTKKDIVEYLEVDPKKIDVIYHGFSPIKHDRDLKAKGDYILFVGRRALYKNFTFFINAIHGILKKDNTLKLICVGPSFTFEENSLLESLGIKNQTIAISVNDKKLNELYSNAKVFVFPSLYEGFGIPILEAFSNNCPVSLSNSSCFPEIAGDAASYFDPYNKESLIKSINRIIYDSDYAAELVQKGRERLNDFSWEKTAMETLESYKKTICQW